MYEISKELWHTCKITGKKITDLAKTYGGTGVYYTGVFTKYLKEEHGIDPEYYFIKYCKLKPPVCFCGICNKECSLSTKKSSNFSWKKYYCGRNEGVLEWSEQAKESRKGSGNPMFNKKPWNKDLTKEDSESLMSVSQKMTGREVSESIKEKMSVSATNRDFHGFTGRKHSDKSKEKMRDNTLKMIKEGRYSQLKTKPHLKMCSILNDLELSFDEEVVLGYWSFDFYLNKYDLYIEVDGDYFHSNPIIYPNGPITKTQKKNCYRDKNKNTFCKDNNIVLVRFWECDILNNEELIKCKLKELLGLNF